MNAALSFCTSCISVFNNQNIYLPVHRDMRKQEVMIKDAGFSALIILQCNTAVRCVHLDKERIKKKKKKVQLSKQSNGASYKLQLKIMRHSHTSS